MHFGESRAKQIPGPHWPSSGAKSANFLVRDAVSKNKADSSWESIIKVDLWHSHEHAYMHTCTLQACLPMPHTRRHCQPKLSWKETHIEISYGEKKHAWEMSCFLASVISLCPLSPEHCSLAGVFHSSDLCWGLWRNEEGLGVASWRCPVEWGTCLPSWCDL